jgi:hypothetical protein
MRWKLPVLTVLRRFVEAIIGFWKPNQYRREVCLRSIRSMIWIALQLHFEVYNIGNSFTAFDFDWWFKLSMRTVKNVADRFRISLILFLEQLTFRRAATAMREVRAGLTARYSVGSKHVRNDHNSRWHGTRQQTGGHAGSGLHSRP